MRLLHLSDLHLSRYGESGTWTRREPDDDERWTAVRIWQRWQIEGCRDRRGRPDKLRLVDPEGLIHKVKSWPRRDEKLIAQFLTRAMRRHQTSTERLVSERPQPDELDALLGVDPRNTNLRFMRVLDHIVALQPGIIAITGDLTNNGFGYELLRHYLAPWSERGRLFTVPGNHDAYDILPRLGRAARAAHKADCYRGFADSIGLTCNPVGSYVRRVDDIAIVGLDSCKMPRTPLSASGAVSHEQLVWLRELGRDAAFAGARLRVGLVHHHLLRMPFQIGRRTPLEMGMRLRNAVEVLEICSEARMDLLLNGHRHHGYMVQLPGRPTVISAPSSTRGCKSTGQTYAWLINLADRYPFPVVHPLEGRPL